MEYHSKETMSATGFGSWMAAMYRFVINSGQGIVRLATEDSKIAAYAADPSGGGLALSTTALSADAKTNANWWTNGSYIVIEPVREYFTGGGRWQLKITRTGTNTIKYEMAPSGGWVSASHNFGSANTTGEIQLFASTDQASGGVAASAMWMSCATQAYSSSRQYAYFRLILKHGGLECMKAIYCGGYIPLSPDSDTKPICVLAGKPWGSQAKDGTDPDPDSYWGTSHTGTLSRTPPDYAHTGSPSGTGCYIRHIDHMADNGTANATQDRSGRYAAPSVYLFSSDGKCLGLFGSMSFRGFDAYLAAWTVDNSGRYIKLRDLIHRFY